jgi:hypothetical protein
VARCERATEIADGVRDHFMAVLMLVKVVLTFEPRL